jgi:hypothetical protein
MQKSGEDVNLRESLEDESGYPVGAWVAVVVRVTH